MDKVLILECNLPDDDYCFFVLKIDSDIERIKKLLTDWGCFNIRITERDVI